MRLVDDVAILASIAPLLRCIEEATRVYANTEVRVLTNWAQVAFIMDFDSILFRLICERR